MSAPFMLVDVLNDVRVNIPYNTADMCWFDRVGDQGEGQWEEDR
jgi:hypothetical protein